MDIICLTKSKPPAYFQQIAQLHAAEIKHGVLPLLGNEFLAKLYSEMCRSPRNSIWIAIEKGKVLGFLAGCADFSQSCRRLIWQSGFFLGWSALHSLSNPRVLIKLLSLLIYPFRKTGDRFGSPERHSSGTVRAELLAMAVHHEAHRQGIGRVLIASFEKSLSYWGVADGYWVATDSAQMVSNQFYLSLGFKPTGKVKHHDLVLQHYYKKLNGATG